MERSFQWSVWWWLHAKENWWNCVTVSDPSGHSFEPDFEEPIQVVQEFDFALKHATFVVNRYASEENNNECQPETSRNGPNCFDILMKAQLQCTKLPQLLNEDAPRFTGLFWNWIKN